MKPFKLIFISALMILIMTNATPISHLNAQANEENKKLKYEQGVKQEITYVYEKTEAELTPLTPADC